MSKATTDRSRSRTPVSPLSPQAAEFQEHRINNWLHTSTYPTPPPSYARDIPLSEYLVPTRISRDADYDWLVDYPTSTINVDDRILQETLPKLQKDASNAALANAVAEIIWLTGQLDERISFASTPVLKISITNGKMYADRDWHWYFTADTICKLEDPNKVICLQAARAEIAWLRAECSRLQQVIWDRHLSLQDGGELEELEYVPTQRSMV